MRKTRGGGGLTIGLILAHPDEFQGPGLLVPAETEGQRHGLGFVLLPGRREELFFGQGLQEEGGQGLMALGDLFELVRGGLEFPQGPVPVRRESSTARAWGSNRGGIRMPSSNRDLTFWARTWSNCRLSRSMTFWRSMNSTLGGRSGRKKEVTVGT